MSFLAPLFLLGALAVAGPVIFHLIRRTTRDRVRFSSLMFLRPTPPRLTKRSRIEHWLLLLLRALALGLLALAFARPLWKSNSPPPPATTAGGRTAIVVDVSASMQRGEVWPSAQSAVRTALRDAADTHDIALIAFDRATRTVLSFEDWRSLPAETREAETLARLETLEPAWLGTDVASALMTAAEALAEGDSLDAGAPRRIVLVSDLQDGSRLDAIQSYDWPQGVEVTVAAVAAGIPGNAGVHLAAGGPEVATNDPDAGVRVRVLNAPDSTSETFQLGWADAEGRAFAGPAVDAYVPPGQSRLVTVPWPDGGPTAGRIRLAGDAHAFDNLVATAPAAQTRVRVLHFGQDAPADPRQPLFFLQKAMPQSPRLATEVVSLPPAGPLAPDAFQDVRIAVVTEPLEAAVANALRAHVNAGATALVVLNSPEMAGTLSALADAGSITLKETTPSTYAMLGEIDFRHPLFAPFADPRFSDFTKIRFQRYRKLDAAGLPEARVAARFDSGDPAVVESTEGGGRLVVLTSSWVGADSQLAVSSKFPSLLASLLEWSGATRLAATSFAVGEPIPRLALGVAEGVAVNVTTPEGDTAALEAGAPAFLATDGPGLFEVEAGGARRWLPVNLDPAESRTAPLADDDLERLGVPLARAADRARAAGARLAPTPAAETESRQKLWRWFLAAALAVLLLETLLAGRAARRTLTPTEAAP